MVRPTQNPYEPSSAGEVMLKPERSKTGSFLMGARSGGLWSLLLVVSVTPTLVSELSLMRRSAVDKAFGGPIPLSASETAFYWMEGIVTSFLMITLPWSVTAGLVRMAKDSKRIREQAHSD